MLHCLAAALPTHADTRNTLQCASFHIQLESKPAIENDHADVMRAGATAADDVDGNDNDLDNERDVNDLETLNAECESEEDSEDPANAHFAFATSCDSDGDDQDG